MTVVVLEHAGWGSCPLGNYESMGQTGHGPSATVSAGCIRMFNEDVVEVFEWVNVGTRVKIQVPLIWLAGSVAEP